MNIKLLLSSASIATAVAIGVCSSSDVAAHCDGMDGPVVKAARAALEARDVRLVLVWVKRESEPEIRDAFSRTLAVRALSPAARDLADLYFFETLVRVHRAGEGAPYEGLKPAGRDLGPAIPAVDRALENGNGEPLLKLLRDAVEAGLGERLERALACKGYRPEDIDGGREYVEAYVSLVHFTEGLYDAATRHAPGHPGARQPEPSGAHRH